MPEHRAVYVIDDDEAIRESAAMLLETHALNVQTFASARAFLDLAAALAPGCVVTDMRMPGIDGLELLRRLDGAGLRLPVIVMTAHGEVALAVQALKAGAVDFIEKPFPGEVLVDAVLAALRTLERTWRGDAELSAIGARIAALTAREREVFEQLIAGAPNKVVAWNLGISQRTVEAHRARIMEKMQARSLPALVRMAVAAGLVPAIGR